MFYVYGVAMSDCVKQAKKLVSNESNTNSQSDFDNAVMEKAKALFLKAKMKPISGELSCPERVRQFLELAEKDTPVRALQPMKKVPELDGDGNAITTKKGKPKFKIVPMSLGDL